MTLEAPVTELDSRFSTPDATALPWMDAERQLQNAGVFWVSTVRPEGRPHVVPLIAVWLDGALFFATGEDERTGYAEGSVAVSARPRLLAEATLDALRQLEPAAECLDVDTAHITRAGSHDVVIVLLVSVDPPYERHLSGSAIVHQLTDDAVVRAVLDATNRRLPHLARDHDRY